MITTKKLNKRINEIDKILTDRINKINENIEKKEEFDILIKKIKNYFNKNPKNCFQLSFIDLTQGKIIININNIKTCEAK